MPDTYPVDEAGHPLLSPTSRARGYCEACRIGRGEPAEPYDYRRIPNPEPKLLAAMEEMEATERG